MFAVPADGIPYMCGAGVDCGTSTERYREPLPYAVKEEKRGVYRLLADTFAKARMPGCVNERLSRSRLYVWP
jgi:hypothetical protein